MPEDDPATNERDEAEFVRVTRRLLATPPQPHNAPKSDKAKGSKDDNRKPKGRPRKETKPA